MPKLVTVTYFNKDNYSFDVMLLLNYYGQSLVVVELIL